MRVYRLNYRNICNNQRNMTAGWPFHLSRKDQMKSDTKIYDPMQILLEKS